VAICGIPPLNGFISEFIIYNGFFTTAKELKNYYPLMMLLAVVGLALVGGLATACFTKVNSIMFLGSERRKVEKFTVSVYEYLSMGMLASFCVIIGFYPQPFLAVISNVLNDGIVPKTASSPLTELNWYIGGAFLAILLGILLVWLAKQLLQNQFGHKVSAPWGCGYQGLTSRMQYSASSFADELNLIASAVLVYHKRVKAPQTIFPTGSHLETHSEDLVDKKMLIPAGRKLGRLVARIEFLSNPDIRYYIAFILIMITVYTLIAFVWF